MNIPRLCGLCVEKSFHFTKLASEGVGGVPSLGIRFDLAPANRAFSACAHSEAEDAAVLVAIEYRGSTPP